jgi:urate oxidase
MAIRLGQNNYGKSRVRLLRATKHDGRHEIKELTLAISFEGEFEMVHTKGDNSKVLPTDTIKNTVYALARRHPMKSVEDFSMKLIDHFLSGNEYVARVRVEAVEDLWTRILVDGKPQSSAFVRAGEEKRTALLDGTRKGVVIRAGIMNLIAMKTADSAFEGFMRDPYTTLKEDRDRIMATSIRASWLYDSGTTIDFDSMWTGVKTTLLEAFAEHKSESLQHTLYAMGEAVIAKFGQIRDIHLSLPNKHYNLLNLSPFGMENPAEVFLPTDEPHGLIEGTVQRD